MMQWCIIQASTLHVSVHFNTVLLFDEAEGRNLVQASCFHALCETFIHCAMLLSHIVTSHGLGVSKCPASTSCFEMCFVSQHPTF